MIHSMILENLVSPQEVDQIISTALKCLENRLRYDAEKYLNSSESVSAFLRLQLAQESDEVFAALFLNSQQRLIAFEKLFFGTINQSTVHPRKIVKKCLEYNASKLIIAHNHPSQNCKPSKADQHITNELKDILNVIDVQLIDHFIVAPQEAFSFAEHHLL